MKKLISFTLVAALLCMLAVAAAGAVSAADKADITINGFNCPGNEGTTAILTGEKVGASLLWWQVLVFEPDTESGGYKCITKTSADGETDKTQLVIPAGGFAVGTNTGNNYPDLYENDPTKEEYKDKPNYITEANQAAYAAVAATEVGDIVYLVGIDLEKGTIDDNASDELLWYQDGYVSNAKLTFTKPSDSATDESENEPADEGEASVVNAALGKTYTLKGLFTGEGAWPDEGGTTLTDGKGATQVGYADPAWVGLKCQRRRYGYERGRSG